LDRNDNRTIRGWQNPIGKHREPYGAKIFAAKLSNQLTFNIVIEQAFVTNLHGVNQYKKEYNECVI
jgi:hypothetical protein